MSARSFTGFARFGFACAAAATSASAAVTFNDNFDSYTADQPAPNPPYLTTLAALAPTGGTSTRSLTIFATTPTDKDLRGAVTSTIPVGISATQTNSGTVGTTVTGISGGNFTASTEVTFNGINGSGASTINFALAVLSNSTSLATGGYRVTYFPFSNSAAQNQKLVISELTSPADITTDITSLSLAPVVGTTYTLTVNGDYTTNPGKLSLTATLSGGAGSPITTKITDASPSAGNNFGDRVAAQAGRPGADTSAPFTVAIDASFDQFTVTNVVPEPATLAALLGLAGLAVGRRRA